MAIAAEGRDDGSERPRDDHGSDDDAQQDGRKRAHSESKARNFMFPEPWQDLLGTHREAVRRLKRTLGRDARSLDELDLLRYVISNDGDADKEAEAVREMLRWRKDNARTLKALEGGGTYPRETDIKRFLLMAITGTLDDGGPVNVVRLGRSDCKGLMGAFDVDEVANALTFEKERLFRICDEATRRTGRLVKAVTVMDLAGFSMVGGDFDKRVLKALGKSSKQSSKLYPQLQARTVAVNAPHFYSMLRSALSTVMPSSSMEKMVVCGGKNSHEKHAGSDCPFMRRYNAAADAVPPLLGGNAETPDDLLPVGSRRRNRPGEPGRAPFETVKVPARCVLEVQVPVAEPGSLMHLEARTKKHHVLMSAQVRPRGAGAEEIESDESVNEEEEDAQERDDRDNDADDDDDESGTSSMSSSDDEGEGEPNDMRKSDCGCGSTAYTSRLRKHLPAIGRGSEETQRTAREAESGGVLPVRLGAKHGSVRGSWVVPVAGAVRLRFDNGFSKLRSKKVSFRLCVSPPGQDCCPSFVDSDDDDNDDKAKKDRHRTRGGDKNDTHKPQAGPAMSHVLAAFAIGLLLQLLLAWRLQQA